MGMVSIPLTAAAFVYMLLDVGTRPFAAFAGILLVIQIQIRAAERSADRVAFPPSRHPAALAEDMSWRSGRAHVPLAPHVLSPWWTSYTNVLAGHPSPSQPIVEDLRDRVGEHAVWWPPVAATSEQLDIVVSRLPRPLPTPTSSTPARSALTLLDVLRRTRHFDDAITYGTQLFNVQPSADVAIEIARCLALVDQPGLAVDWLQTAALDPDKYDHLRLVIAFLPEFQSLHERQDFQALVTALDPQD